MLFKSDINLNLKDAEISYYEDFFDTNDAHYYFESLLSTIKWQQDSITIYGKTHLQPRLTSFYDNNKNTYKYSNITM